MLAFVSTDFAFKFRLLSVGQCILFCFRFCFLFMLPVVFSAICSLLFVFGPLCHCSASFFFKPIIRFFVSIKISAYLPTRFYVLWYDLLHGLCVCEDFCGCSSRYLSVCVPFSDLNLFKIGIGMISSFTIVCTNSVWPFLSFLFSVGLAMYFF